MEVIEGKLTAADVVAVTGSGLAMATTGDAEAAGASCASAQVMASFTHAVPALAYKFQLSVQRDAMRISCQIKMTIDSLATAPMSVQTSPAQRENVSLVRHLTVASSEERFNRSP